MLKVTIKSTKTRKGPLFFNFEVENEEEVMDILAGASVVKGFYDLWQLFQKSG